MGIAYKRDSVLSVQFDDLYYRPKFLNAYAVTLGYGGPEEGGWWYDKKEPLASVRISTREEAHRILNVLETLYYQNYVDEPARSSTISDGDLSITIEDHLAEYSPKVRPHYE